jgi:hypothetical protein
VLAYDPRPAAEPVPDYDPEETLCPP